MSDKKTKQALAIAAMLSGENVREVALAAGVTDRTIYRWQKDDNFKKQLRQAENDLMERVLRRLVSLADKAIDNLVIVLDSPQERGQNVRRLAARDILDTILRIHDVRQVDERLAELEDRVNAWL